MIWYIIQIDKLFEYVPNIVRFSTVINGGQIMQFGMPYGMNNGYDMGYGIGIFGLIFLILVIIGLVLLIRYLWESKGAKREQESAFDILKKRYARGDISKEEFEDKKKDL